MDWTVIGIIGGAGIVLLIVSAYLTRRARREHAGRTVDPDAVRTEVVAALDGEGLAEAVRIYRRRTGAPLLEATEAVRRIDESR
ncbi:hypothetical protein [Cryptosporangium japonicum]